MCLPSTFALLIYGYVERGLLPNRCSMVADTLCNQSLALRWLTHRRWMKYLRCSSISWIAVPSNSILTSCSCFQFCAAYRCWLLKNFFVQAFAMIFSHVSHHCFLGVAYYWLWMRWRACWAHLHSQVMVMKHMGFHQIEAKGSLTCCAAKFRFSVDKDIANERQWVFSAIFTRVVELWQKFLITLDELSCNWKKKH